MKILIKQFLGKRHSWSVCGWGMAKSFLKNNQVDLFSTDGIKNLPGELKENLIGYTEENQNKVIGRNPDGNYDCQISYTAMKNFPHYLSYGGKNRFGIWTFEWAGKNVLPTGFAKNYKACDYLLAPSNFSKQIFLDSGISESSIRVISHGIGSEYRNDDKIKLPTNKSVKILSNIAQNHIRKNIPGLLEVYGRAFSKKDDVSLILKCSDKPIQNQFDISVGDCLKDFYRKFPDHAEIKLFKDFLPDISKLYRSVDMTFTMTHCEGFYFPGLESIASGKLAIAPGWGGQLDFLNQDNALLISGKEGRANPKSMYWESKYNAVWFEPSVDDAVEKLKFAVANYKKLNEKIEESRPVIYRDYSWDAVTGKILELCK